MAEQNWMLPSRTEVIANERNQTPAPGPFSAYRLTFVTLGSLLVAAATVATRLHGIGRSLWLDETWLANSILQPSIRETLYYESWLQTTPPLFLIMLRFVAYHLGVSNETLRLVPALFGIASVAPMTYIACRVLAPPFSFLSIFLFVFSPSLLYYSHQLKQYTGDVFASLLLGSIGLMYLRKPTRTRLYLCSTTFVILALFSYPALLWAPALLFALLVTMTRVFVAQSPARGPRWSDAVAFGVCALSVAIVDYFVFIRPNLQPILEEFFRSGFFRGKNVWAFLKFYVNESLRLASLLFPREPHSIERLMQIFTALVLVAAAVSLYLCWKNRSRGNLSELLFLALPIPTVFVLNLLGLYPLHPVRLLLFLAPVVIVLFAYGIQAISLFVSSVAFPSAHSQKKQRVLRAMGVCVLVPLLGLHIMLSGASPLSRLEPIEDSESAVRYLSHHIQAHSTIYIHASMREQFKFYSQLTPVHASKIVWGKFGSPCCPRDVFLDRKKQIRDGLSTELSRVVVPESNTSIWFLYTDRADHWDWLGRNDPQAFESWLTKAGYILIQVVRFRGVRIDEYRSSRSSSLVAGEQFRIFRQAEWVIS